MSERRNILQPQRGTGHSGTMAASLQSYQAAYQPWIIDRINRWLEAKKITLLHDGGFNHYRVMVAAIPLLTKKAVAGDTIASFEALFEKINSALGSDTSHTEDKKKR